MEVLHTVGKRKTSIARIYIQEGKGNIIINGKKMEEYFPTIKHQYTVMQPLRLLNMEDKFDIKVNLQGGGITGQAEALRHAISKALTQLYPEHHTELKKAGFLTRDSRIVERKKYGQPKARKQFQFSKR